ncbi:anti-sigma factor family protein [Streptomyces sp. NBC_01198]|uniref:anti-sigma factor family protein n=1 Tax=Streptomyces sp. NBC_01198 TaxID=2903769 RepID=UPI002E16003E|nr:zf-HC2 domain-containing protein [Streptomyces sp. NBC_01198]
MNPHVDVGAYLLGVLDDDEMARFEAHLVDCEVCGDELDQLSGVVPVLDELRADGLGFAEMPGGDAMLDRLLARVAAERRRHRRRRLVAIAAAAVLVVGGPTVAVLAVHGSGGSHPVAQSFGSDRHTASNPTTGVSAVVALTDKGWGSAVDLRLTGVHGPLTCSLVAFAGDGGGQTVATWSVPSEGYGTDTQPSPLTVHGAAGLHPADITRFDVRTDTGALLVTVPTRAG